MKQITIIFLALIATLVGAQNIPHGVCPIGLSDCNTDGFHSAVKNYTETIYNVVLERGLTQKGTQTSCVNCEYDENGNIQSKRTFDADGQKLTGTLYQYRNNMKYVATTRDANGKRTIQILYEQNDSNNLCTLMRMTDAIAITISTMRIRHEHLYVRTTETYHDGEVINTNYFYNKNGTLRKIVSDADANPTTTFSYGIFSFLTKKILPTKKTIATLRQTSVYTYDYQTDEHGEWIHRITYLNGKPIEIAERVIEYW